MKEILGDIGLGMIAVLVLHLFFTWHTISIIWLVAAICLILYFIYTYFTKIKNY